MNILLINYEFPPIGAGAATATWHIGKELAAMGHNVLVLTSGYKTKQGYDAQEGMRIFRCPAIRKKASESNMLEMASFVISAFCFLPRLIRKHQIQSSVIFFSFPCGPLGLWINFLYKIPYIISLRGGDVPGTEKSLDRVHTFLKPLRRWVLNKSKAVVANSQGLKLLAVKADPINISVIPNGIDTDFFRPDKFKQSDKKFEFLFAGRFSEQKNLAFLLEQFAVLAKKHERKIILHMVGDGPLRDDLKFRAEKLRISDSVLWHGWVEKTKLLALLRKVDCFINPSLYEGMPNTVLEAMSCGLPVIASDVAGNNEVVTENRTGFLFQLNNPKQALQAMHRMIVNPELTYRMGQNARKSAKIDFSWKETVRQYLHMIIGP